MKNKTLFSILFISIYALSSHIALCGEAHAYGAEEKNSTNSDKSHSSPALSVYVEDTVDATEALKELSGGGAGPAKGTDSWALFAELINSYDPLQIEQGKKWVNLAEKFPSASNITASELMRMREMYRSVRHIGNFTDERLKEYFLEDSKRTGFTEQAVRGIGSIVRGMEKSAVYYAKKEEPFNRKKAEGLTKSYILFRLITQDDCASELTNLSSMMLHGASNKAIESKFKGRNYYYISAIRPFLAKNKSTTKYLASVEEMLTKKTSAQIISDAEMEYLKNSVKCSLLSETKEQAAHYLEHVKIASEKCISKISSINNRTDMVLIISAVNTSRMIAMSRGLAKDVEFFEGELNALQSALDGNKDILRMIKECSGNKAKDLVDYFPGTLVVYPTNEVYQINPFDGSLVPDGSRPSPPTNWKDNIPWKSSIPRK